MGLGCMSIFGECEEGVDWVRLCIVVFLRCENWELSTILAILSCMCGMIANADDR